MGRLMTVRPSTCTIGSGDEASRDAGLQTLKGIELIKKHMPGVRTILGLSNISFGLDPYPRQILNSVYLAEARRHGLDAAIVHASKIIPTHKLDEEDKQVTLDLIHDRRREGYDPLFAFLGRFAGKKRVGITAGASAPEVLENALIERLKALGAARVQPLDGIVEDVVFTLPRELSRKSGAG